MNKIFRLLIIFICIIMYVDVCGQSYYSDLLWEVDGIKYTTSYGISDESQVTEVYVTNTEGKDPFWGMPNSCYTGDITIPSHITLSGREIPVTGIAMYAFCNSKINAVVLPSSVKIIEEKAFYGCKDLTSIIMPNVEEMRSRIFEGCEMLRKIALPKSLSNMMYDALSCSGLLEIEVDADDCNYSTIDGVLYSKDKSSLIAFPSKRTEIHLPETLTFIEPHAFEGSDISSIVFPPSVRYILNYAFSETKKLKSVVIPPTVENMSTGVFRESGIESVEYQCSSCDKLLFEDCKQLSSVVLSEELKTIPNAFFRGCTALKNIVIPDKVEKIEDGSFDFTGGMDGMESITLGKSVKLIESNAFEYTYIKNLICHNYPPEFDFGEFWWMPTHPFNYDTYENCNLYVPDYLVSDYRHNEYWGEFKNIFPISSITVNEKPVTDEAYTIQGNTISFTPEEGTPVNIYSIDGMSLFKSCNGATTIELPSGLYILQIGNKAQRICIQSL